MRHLLLLSLSMLFSACSAHNNNIYHPATNIKAPISSQHQLCSEQDCGTAKLPWQEILRRKNLSTALTISGSTKNMSASETKQIINDVYQHVMASTRYIDDAQAYGRFDLYPTPAELEGAKKDGRYRGDCTTFSHLFYYKLIERGIDPARILRVRMDNLHRQGPVTNHMAVLVDNTWLLDNNESSQKVIRFEQSGSTPKMWLSETKIGWYIAARGHSPLLDTRFKGFSTAMF